MDLNIKLYLFDWRRKIISSEEEYAFYHAQKIEVLSSTKKKFWEPETDYFQLLGRIEDFIWYIKRYEQKH